MIQGEQGDLFFTAGASSLGGAIRWAEQTRGEEPTEMNHVGVVSKKGYILPCAQPTWVDPPYLKPAVVIESLWRTIEHPWYPDQKPGNEVSVWRYEPITLLQQIVVIQRAERFVGAKYGWWKLLTHFVDNKAFNGRVVTRKLLVADSRPICSYTAACSFHVAGIKTGDIPARTQSPDTMWDFVNASNPWFEVGRGVT